MFSNLSINPFLVEGRIVDRPQKGNKSQYSLGLPEWQQDYQSTHRDLYTPKNLHGNRAILDKPYLKPNYSGFQLHLFPQEKPFLTSNLRDYNYKKLKNEDKAILDEKTRNFIKRETSDTSWEISISNRIPNFSIFSINKRGIFISYIMFIFIFIKIIKRIHFCMIFKN